MPMRNVLVTGGVCCLLLVASPFQLPANEQVPGASRFPEIYLLNASVVHEDLCVDDETKMHLDEIYRQFALAVQRKWAESNRMEGSDAEKIDSKEFGADLRKLRSEYSAQAVACLSEPQRVRIKQIQWQFQSINRYRDIEFIGSLDLSDRQRGAITSIVKSFHLNSAILLRQSAQKVLTQEQVWKGLKATERKACEQIDEILTPDQRQRAADLLKPPICFGLVDISTKITLRRVAAPAR